MELENEINNDLKIEEKQNNFFDTMFGKVVDNGIDIGLRAILPDLIEEQVIDIKNALLKNGISEGIQTAVKSVSDFAKSALGIVTGKFENMEQIEIAVGDGGLVDTISSALDNATDKIYEKGYINRTINNIIKSGKDILLENVTQKIKEEIDEQNNSIESLEKYMDNWKDYYNNKNFEGMEKEIEKIQEKLEDVVPLEKIIKEARNIETLHELIKNKGQSFEITQTERELINKLS